MTEPLGSFGGASNLPAEEARAFIYAVVRRHLGGGCPHAEDLGQDAVLLLLRVARREEIRNWRALAATIARRVAASHVRPPRGCGSNEQPLEPDSPFEPATRGTDYAWLLHRIVEEMETSKSPCLDLLLRHGWDGESIESLAGEMKLSSEALRQRWHRCCVELKKKYGELWKLLRDPRWPDRFGGTS